MLKKASKFFVDLDEFGHPVTFNFNQEGDTYKTCFGASTSVAMKVFLLFFLYIKFAIFVTKSNNSIGYEISSTNITEIGALKLDDIDVYPYLVVSKNGLPVYMSYFVGSEKCISIVCIAYFYGFIFSR